MTAPGPDHRGFELGEQVQLDKRVNIGFRYRQGTIVGFGEVHPDHFPVRDPRYSNPPGPVVIVIGPSGGIDVWSVDRCVRPGSDWAVGDPG